MCDHHVRASAYGARKKPLNQQRENEATDAPLPAAQGRHNRVASAFVLAQRLDKLLLLACPTKRDALHPPCRERRDLAGRLRSPVQFGLQPAHHHEFDLMPRHLIGTELCGRCDSVASVGVDEMVISLDSELARPDARAGPTSGRSLDPGLRD